MTIEMKIRRSGLFASAIAGTFVAAGVAVCRTEFSPASGRKPPRRRFLDDRSSSPRPKTTGDEGDEGGRR